MKATVATISFTTHSDHMNYGAILHTWAFHRYLLSRGVAAVAIDYIPRQLEGYSLKWPMLNAVRLWRHPLRAVLHLARWMVSGAANLRKYRKVRAFLVNALACTAATYRERDLLRLEALPDADVRTYVCESDVIWKRRPGQPLDRGFFLAFPAAERARRVAYAPSLAKSPFTREEANAVRAAVSGFVALSAREASSAAVLSGLTGRTVVPVVDPVFLLPAEDYARIAVQPKSRGYVLLYTCMQFNPKMVAEARRYASRRGLRLVEVGNYGINRCLFGHCVIDDAGVEEWLGLVANAEAVVCNSYHGICFSVIFKKPFYAFLRAGDDLRLEDVCQLLGLTNRLVERNGKIPLVEEPIDFAAVEARLAVRRAASESYLESAVIRAERGERVP